MVAPIRAGGATTGSGENALVAVLTLTFGVVMVDRLALNFLTPFVVDDLHLSNTQVGVLATGLSTTLALSGIVIGRLSDRVGRQKLILVSAIIGFSLASFLSGLTASFGMLLAARLLMGLFEGPVLPISQVLLSKASSPARRGFNMGVMQMFGSNVLGTFVAPLVLIAVAERAGWRSAFYLAGAPGLLCALLTWFIVRDPDRQPEPASRLEPLAPSRRGVFATRNVWLCLALTGLIVGWVLLCFTFLPLIFTRVLGHSSTEMSVFMGVLGLSAVVSGFVVPGLSDILGRKRTISIAAALGLVVPLGVSLASGSTPILLCCLFVGFLATGLAPLVMATIPSESVDTRHVATAVGFVIGAGEILAGLVGPLTGGWIADRAGLLATLWLQAALLGAVVLLSTLLVETAPRVRSRLGPGYVPDSDNRASM